MTSVAAGLRPRGDGPTETEAWALLLSVDRLGPAGFGALLATYGSGREILAAAGRRRAIGSFDAIVAAAQGRVDPKARVGSAIVELAADPGPSLQILRSSGVRIVTLDDPDYPARLRAIDLPPPVLLVDGDVAAWSARRSVAIVGTRRPTVPVLGSGHRRLYPRAHVRLASEVVATGGVVVSEMFPDRRPTKGTFPQRNRLISGLADATIVVEAGHRSGALITADWALLQGRDCYLVPGPVDEPRSAGILDFHREFHDLVRLVTGIPELLVDLGLDPAAAGVAGSSTRRQAVARLPSVSAELIELGQTAREIATALIAGNGSIDELAVATGHTPATILGAITLLEMRGLATSTYGRYRAAGRLASALPGDGRRRVRPRYRSTTRIDALRAARGLPAQRGPC